MIITLDGPAGVGKSSLAKELAKHFNIASLDTGAMYRTLGLKLGRNAANMSEAEIIEKLHECKFELKEVEGDYILFFNSKAIGNEIRNEEVGKLAAIVGNIPIIRKKLRDFQIQIGEEISLVAEGRDMGTVVFPRAEFKFYLDASPEVRAQRRFAQLQEKGQEACLSQILEEIFQRDQADRERVNDPLRPAKDAVIIDTSNLSRKKVFDKIVQIISTN